MGRDMTSIETMMNRIGQQAREAAVVLSRAGTQSKNDALTAAAEFVESSCGEILAANAEDLDQGKVKGLSEPMLDRLALDEGRVGSVAASLRDVGRLEDPVGSVIASWTRPNGLKIRRVRTPLGVVAVIFESRPNVTADAGGLCLKAGNAAILRGGSESLRSSAAIHQCLVRGLRSAGLPEAAIQMVQTADRTAVREILAGCGGTIDVLVPRGGRSLVERVQREARVPVFAHLEGICHVYVDAKADWERARAISVNAKMRRTSICGAAECILFDRGAPRDLVSLIVGDLIQAGCEVRADEAVRALHSGAVPATDEDWGREFLAPVVAARFVNGVDGAIEHIRRHGSAHTDAIITESDSQADRFFRHLDSAILMRNASTQFADGGEFGLGAEIGIATGKMHARGPVGVEQLTTFQYLVDGDGAVRP